MIQISWQPLVTSKHSSFESWQAFVKFNVNGCDVKKFRTFALQKLGGFVDLLVQTSSVSFCFLKTTELSAGCSLQPIINTPHLKTKKFPERLMVGSDSDDNFKNKMHQLFRGFQKKHLPKIMPFFGGRWATHGRKNISQQAALRLGLHRTTPIHKNSNGHGKEDPVFVKKALQQLG